MKSRELKPFEPAQYYQVHRSNTTDKGFGVKLLPEAIDWIAHHYAQKFKTKISTDIEMRDFLKKIQQDEDIKQRSKRPYHLQKSRLNAISNSISWCYSRITKS